jgi:mannosyltransferase OCH1-like enzyme
MIPRTLHFIWLGPRKLPVEWLRAWRAKHLDWEHRVWNEADIRALPLRNRRVFDAYLARPHYPGAADVARVEILLACGGVYTDIDSEPLRSLEGAPFMDAGFFVARTLPVKGHPGRVGNGTMGAERGHPVLVDYAEAIDRQSNIWPAWDTSGGTLLTEVLGRHADDPTVRILPAGSFYPRGRHGERANDGSIAYIQHFWASSPRAIRAYP